MNDQQLEMWVARQVDLLIESGYLDVERRAEVEAKMLRQKKAETEVSAQNDH